MLATTVSLVVFHQLGEMRPPICFEALTDTVPILHRNGARDSPQRCEGQTASGVRETTENREKKRMTYKIKYTSAAARLKALRYYYATRGGSMTTVAMDTRDKATDISTGYLSGNPTEMAKAVRSSDACLTEALKLTTAAFMPDIASAEIAYRIIEKPLRRYYKWFADWIEKSSNNEAILIQYYLTRYLQDPDWFKDLAELVARKYDLIKIWIQEHVLTPAKTGLNDLGKHEKTIEEVILEHETISLQMPRNDPGIDPEMQKIYDAGKLPVRMNDILIRRFGGSATLSGECLSREGNEDYLRAAWAEYNRKNLGLPSTTGIPSVDKALDMMLGKDIAMARFKSQGLLTDLITVAMFMPLPITKVTAAGKVIVPSLLKRAAPLLGGIGTKLASTVGSILKALVTNDVTGKVVPGKIIKSVLGATAGYLGTTVMGNFILEEGLQQCTFAEGKLSVYDTAGGKRITDTFDKMIENRWKVYVPFYGPLWSFERYFSAAKLLNQAYKDKFSSYAGKAKRKTKMIKEEEE